MMAPASIADPEVCRFPCAICDWMVADQTPEWLSRIRATFVSVPPRIERPRKEPRPPKERQRQPGQSRPNERIDRSPLLALLSADRWTTSAEIAASVEMTAKSVSQALCRARERGAPVEGRRNVGYRLTAWPPSEQAGGDGGQG